MMLYSCTHMATVGVKGLKIKSTRCDREVGSEEGWAVSAQRNKLPVI